MLQKVRLDTSRSFDGGLVTISDIFNLKENESPNCINMKFGMDGSLEKILGATSMNTTALQTTGGWACFDFGYGVSSRSIIVAAGTAVYHSTDLGRNFTVIETTRTAGRQYFNRIKHYLINTTDNYDRPMYWTGTAGHMVEVSTALTATKYNIEFQGYAFFFNTKNDNRKVIYEDFNSMIDSEYTNSFSLPSSKDDELTTGILYRQKLYLSTKYKIFKITFVGGNPDFEYKEVKDWGFVPNTVKKVNYKDLGEVIIGLCFDKRVRIFDGSGDDIVSNNIENDNGICEFALSKIDDSQLKNSFAECDINENYYKLGLAITPSSKNTHIACLNVRTGAWFPYRYGKEMMSMCMAESGNRNFLMLMGYNGHCYMADSTNTIDGTAINEWYDSPFLFNRAPRIISKQHTMGLYFSKTSTNTLNYYDAINFADYFTKRASVSINTNVSANQIEKIIDIPVTCNVYQYRLTTDSGSDNPWKLNRTDLCNADFGIGVS